MSTQPLLQRTASKRIALPLKVEPKVAFANERCAHLSRIGARLVRSQTGVFQHISLMAPFYGRPRRVRCSRRCFVPGAVLTVTFNL